MNATIKQYSGPSSSAKAKGLPKAARKFAQQMGLDLTGLEAEADDMWEMLNKMSMEEPAAYENFVDEQMRQQKAEENLPESEKKSAGRMFRPSPGFCIQCRTTGNDGIKIRDFGANSGKDLYLNFVSHEAIEPPKDKSGRPVLDDRGASADGLELPLLIGPVRDVDTTTLAVDVVFHPVILARCESYNLFRTQVIDLALEWTGQETGVQYNKKYEVMPWNYHGGRGTEKSTPVLFPVDEVLARQAGGGIEKCSQEDALLDTIKVQKQKDTLLEMASATAASEDLALPIAMGKAAQNSTKKAKPVGIQEIRPDGTFSPPPVPVVEELNPPASEKKTAKKTKPKGGPSVKKGFLNNTKKSLYPEGSSEGQNGGAYTRLMSRCTVVDTAKLPTGQGSVQPPTAPIEPTSTPVEEHKNPFVDSTPVVQEVPEEPICSNRPQLSVNEQQEIDRMFSGLDDDFASSFSKDQSSKESEDFMTKQLADFAKALSGPNGPNREKDLDLDKFVKEMTEQSNVGAVPSTKTSAEQARPAVCKVNNKLPKHITTDVEISDVMGAKTRELRITVRNVDKSQLKETDLQVSERKIVIDIPTNSGVNADGITNKGGSVHVVPPFACNVNTVKAAMSKKKKCIEIVLSES